MTTTSPPADEPVQDVGTGEMQVPPPAWCDVCSAKVGDPHARECMYFEEES